MTRCMYCGGAIEFRYVGGICTPIHLDGNACTGDGDRPVAPTIRLIESAYAADYCRRTRCPWNPAHEVFFIRHNGGSVYVEDLGWPWPKHECPDRPGADDGYLDRLVFAAGALDEAEPGLVTKTTILDPEGIVEVTILQRGKKMTWGVVETGPSVEKLSGELVAVSKQKDAFVTAWDAVYSLCERSRRCKHCDKPVPVSLM